MYSLLAKMAQTLETEGYYPQPLHYIGIHWLNEQNYRV